MTANELRTKYFEFFKERGHKIIPSASLIPEHDPTVLFTTAGMHPLTPYLLGEKHPEGNRLANVQKCIRTGDIDEVGDAWHLTFFEMLGNWSLGDYGRKEAIEWSWEFLTDKKWLGIKPKRLAVTVFAGDRDIPRDEESAKIWEKCGLNDSQIFYLGKEDNFWGPVGEIGPCGPDTEMFYDTGAKKCGSKCQPGCSCGKYSEIWNDVFMDYTRTHAEQTRNERGKYKYVPLKQKNVDTGMGVERTVAVLNGAKSVYETELFKPIIDEILKIAGAESNREEFLKSNERLVRIMADHIKASVFILGDHRKITPSNLDQGYVLRRLIRRVVRYAKMIGIDIKKEITPSLATAVIKIYKDIYSELEENENHILTELIQEEQKFEKTLEKGLKSFKKMSKDGFVSGKEAFELFSTYGFPLEMTKELTQEQGFKINEQEFHNEFEKHKELSRKGAEQRFKGGLADHSEQAVKYHTATHLLLAALRQVLGEHVLQRGSNITTERLRFDFSHPAKMTSEEIKKAEDLVNEQIKKNLRVSFEEMTPEEAKKQGAIGVFGEKYGEKVKVYSIGHPTGSGQVFSKEICGGPHVKHTGELGKFKIKKEESSSAGIRRIKAVLE